MSDSAIYFPHINLPTESWVARTLLYWDTVKVLAPRAVWEGKPRHFLPHMQRLTDAGLVEKVEPFAYITRERAERFLEVLSGSPDLDQRRRAHKDGDHVKVHLHKLESGVVQALRQHGLASSRPSEGQGEYWMDVEARTAQEYTAAIALAVHQEDPTRPMPITGGAFDRLGFEPAAPHMHRDIDQEHVHRLRERDELREVILHDILPAPEGAEGEFDVDGIIAFRERHQVQARLLRQHIEGLVGELGRESHPGVRANDTLDRLAEIRDQSNDLERKMKEHGWRVRRGAFAALLPTMAVAVVEGAAHNVELADAVERAVTIQPLFVVPILAQLIHRGVEVIREDRAVRHELAADPLAYAVFARDAFGTPSRGSSQPSYQSWREARALLRRRPDGPQGAPPD